MKIIQKDISWLLQRVPDFVDFYERKKGLFTNGFLAGGFLRKSILNGSTLKAMEIMRNERIGDIDFFYHDQASVTSALFKFFSTQPTWNRKIPNRPNSFAGYAYEAYDEIGQQKYQFISFNTGTPDTVLKQFDIANCKIATDGLSVWMEEDWEQLENDKIIRVDNYAGKYLASRLCKYLKDDYKLFHEQREELLSRLMSLHINYNGSIRRLVSNPNFLSPDDALLFYDKLGEVPVDQNNEIDYSLGSLNTKVDYALHVYRKRTNHREP